MGIRHILMYLNSLYVLPGPKYKIRVTAKPSKWAWQRKGVAARYKIGDKSNYVRKGIKYHNPLRNPCEQFDPTEP